MRLFLTVIAVLGWFALAAQFYLILENRAASVPETIIRYFSFFTILTNLLVALCCTFRLIQPAGEAHYFFTRNSVTTAIAVYITIVGIVYNVILRILWNPAGLARLVDELLHTVIPVLFIIFWLLCIPKSHLRWSNMFTWLLYPLVYLIYILLRGAYTGYYPYPFTDVGQLGYHKVFINGLGMLGAFLAVSILFIATDRLIKKERA
jgi:hypothetical protein